MLKSKKIILLVEDDLMQVEMGKVQFEKAGFKFISATNEKDCLMLAREKQPDLILLDMLLGKEYGLDILKEIKKDESIKNIKVVMFTNFTKKGLMQDCLKARATDYLIKSDFVPKELVVKIKNILNIK